MNSANRAKSIDPALSLRYDRTLTFLKRSISPPAKILDLGTPNRLAEMMVERGYGVVNTTVDLDEEPEVVHSVQAEVVTAFEILEHLVAPMNVLRQISAPRLIATIPQRLWFARAYRNPSDPWDRHFHEFEPWQFDWLLEKSGWKIVRSEQWTSPSGQIGFRPILRRIIPRYYAVEAVRVA